MCLCVAILPCVRINDDDDDDDDDTEKILSSPELVMSGGGIYGGTETDENREHGHNGSDHFGLCRFATKYFPEIKVTIFRT